MKKIFAILFVGAAIVACSKDKPAVDKPVSGTPSDLKTITVTIPESLSKVSFSPAAEPGDGVTISWSEGDKIRVISGENSEVYDIQPGFSGHTASFSGPAVEGNSFTVIYPADFESESAAAAGDPFANQVQNGNGSTDGLKYVAVLSGVDSFEDIQFNEEWATAHGGSFRQNGVVRIREQFPADVKSVDQVFMNVKVGSSSMGWISLDFPGGADISSDHILTAYAALPLGDMAIPAAVSIDLSFATGNYDTYTRTLSFESLNLIAGKVNTFNLDKSKLTLQPFYDGAGTETRPYLIGNARQLGNIEAVLVASEATTVNYFKLISDIDLAGNDWDTIVANPYKLIHFDGDNHVIKNMKTVNGGSYEGGFIGILYGTLKNVTFEKVDVISNSNPSGAVCCWAGANDETTWGVLENVHVKGGSVTQNVVQQMGGIAGKARNASFTNCSVEDVTLTATTCSTTTGDNGYGGIAGWAHTSTFTGCEFKNSTLNGGRLAGGIIGYAPTAVTVENCLSSGTIKAKKMEKDGADAVIAEGTESGGHVGEITTMALVPQVVDAVNIPVIAAGGIADGRGVAAAFMLGAEAVQCGTVFCASEEVNIHQNYKDMIIKAKDSSTRVTGRSAGAPVRQIRNQLTNEFIKLEEAHASFEEIEALGVGALRKAVVDGDVKGGTFMAGQIAGMVNEIRPVKDIIEDMFKEANALLAGAKEIV